MWQSTLFVTLVDVLIVAATAFALWTLARQSRRLHQADLVFGPVVLSVGLLAIGLFYLAEIVTLHVFPLIQSSDAAGDATTSLRLNYGWIAALASIVWIVSGVAITNRGLLSLVARLTTSEERWQALSKKLIDVQESERAQIARELHDEIGQALTAVKLNLQSLDRQTQDSGVQTAVADSVAIVDEAVDEIRNLALDLRPSLLDDLGLTAALRWYADRQAARAGLRLEIGADPTGRRPAPEIETTCYRVAQEAITNVIRHAKASELALDLERHADHLVLTVGDDGIGFQVEQVLMGAPAHSRMGLIGMQERVSLVGGQLTVRSSPGTGTTVVARIPMHLSE